MGHKYICLYFSNRTLHTNCVRDVAIHVADQSLIVLTYSLSSHCRPTRVLPNGGLQSAVFRGRSHRHDACQIRAHARGALRDDGLWSRGL